MNHLAFEKSPYLLQHKNNPVNWYPWSEDAFAKARSENKPIFLSIGYSTCYWCHVMEKDSFEHDEVAEIINKYFVAIKVDREELPDVDKFYMDAVVAMHGKGGWPLSASLTPDLKIFWGGTFFYREQFKQILEGLHKAWKTDQERITIVVASILDFVKKDIESVKLDSRYDELIDRAVQQLRARSLGRESSIKR